MATAAWLGPSAAVADGGTGVGAAASRDRGELVQARPQRLADEHPPPARCLRPGPAPRRSGPRPLSLCIYSGGCKARCISAAAVARRDVYRRRLQGDPSARGSSWRATADPYAATTRTDCQRSAAKLVLGTPQVIWDPSRPTSLTLDAIDDGLDWSPYEGFEVPGRVRDVLARGSHVVADGQLTDIGHSGCISRSSAFSRMSGGKR
jgi:hypothetical protein